MSTRVCNRQKDNQPIKVCDSVGQQLAAVSPDHRSDDRKPPVVRQTGPGYGKPYLWAIDYRCMLDGRYRRCPDVLAKAVRDSRADKASHKTTIHLTLRGDAAAVRLANGPRYANRSPGELTAQSYSIK